MNRIKTARKSPSTKSERVDRLESRMALITGASSGIGAAFAYKLASQGYNLILIARRSAKLTQLAASLQKEFHINREVLVADFSQMTDIERIEKRIVGLTNLDLLVNNAGFGDPGLFAENSLTHTTSLIDVHVIASTRLSRAALPGMIARDSGAIINVSSIGAFMPSPPTEIIYCATKAYLNVFSEGLQAQLEIQGANVQIQALCPGFTYTEFHDNPIYEAQKIKTRIPSWLWMSPEEVVEESLRDLKRGQILCIPGIKNRIIVALGRNSLTTIGWSLLRKILRSKHLSNKASKSVLSSI